MTLRADIGATQSNPGISAVVPRICWLTVGLSLQDFFAISPWLDTKNRR